MVSDDDIVKAVVIVLLLAHIAVLIWRRDSIGWVAGLNLLVSAGVTVYWAMHFADLRGSVELVWGFVGFELAVLIVSSLAVLQVRIPAAVMWTAFAAHAALAAAALIFMLTFRMDRLM
jgi:hypothetical protein